MSPVSFPVLAAATATSGPALWSALVAGVLPLDVALSRFLIALAVCWALFSLVAALIDVTPAQLAASDAPPVVPADRREDASATSS